MAGTATDSDAAEIALPEVTFSRHPDSYRHWRLRVEPPVAWLELDVDPAGGLVPGYELKLNSYDLGVDIELHDAVQRLRFEHPEVRAVVLTSARDDAFCAGANIRMLAAAPHHWKVNFCKFTNETRNEIEDAAANSGQVYLAAVNAACAGGGYELALACDRIILVDDNSSTVSLPEVSLLAVLPGTGGLTRLTDKRGVRKDLADLFATRSDGVKGQTAVRWKLVDELAPRREFRDAVRRRALEIAEATQPGGSPERAGIKLEPLRCEVTEDAIRYGYVEATYERDAVAITIRADEAADWLLTMTRELDDLILRLRFNKPELGTWLIRTSGDVDQVLAHERAAGGGGDRLSSETLHYYKRTLKRLDVTSRSLIALIEPGSCFAGMLLELALACDRQYMLDDVEGDEQASIRLTEANFGPFPMASGLTRLQSRFYLDQPGYERVAERAGVGIEDEPGARRNGARVAGLAGRDIGPAEAAELGLVTEAPDDIDWGDEIRIAVEGRAALSPDALTGMEASLRFAGPETMETKIFGRLTAWQNWVFSRPNAAGPDGALRRYGTGRRPAYDRRRT